MREIGQIGLGGDALLRRGTIRTHGARLAQRSGHRPGGQNPTDQRDPGHRADGAERPLGPAAQRRVGDRRDIQQHQAGDILGVVAGQQQRDRATETLPHHDPRADPGRGDDPLQMVRRRGKADRDVVFDDTSTRFGDKRFHQAGEEAGAAGTRPGDQQHPRSGLPHDPHGYVDCAAAVSANRREVARRYFLRKPPATISSLKMVSSLVPEARIGTPASYSRSVSATSRNATL